MIRSFVLAATLLMTPAFAQADEAEDITKLSKTEFLELAEELTMQGFGAQAEMIRRFKADAVSDTLMAPLSDVEREAMSCTWDTLNQSGLTNDYADQVLLVRRMVSLVEADPKFDIVDFFGNQELMLEMGESVSDELAKAQNACGVIQASRPRTAFLIELFPLMTEEMEARGYEF